MKPSLGAADEIPVTLLIGLAYATLALLTDPFAPTGRQLAEHGALIPFAVAAGEPWRLLSYAYLHGGIVHLVFNLSMLASLGPALERALGSLRFLGLYLAGSLGGGLAVTALYPPFGSVVGGSGALFGMLGAVVALNLTAGRHWLDFLDHEGPRRVLGLIAVNLLIGWLLPFVSNTAHLGGLAGGFLATLLWLRPPRRPGPWLLPWRVATAAVALSALLWSLQPVTRWDWLWNQSLGQQDAARQRAMQRAAAMSYYGILWAGDAQLDAFYAAAVAPDGADAPRRR